MYAKIKLTSAQAKEIAYDWYDTIVLAIQGNEKSKNAEEEVENEQSTQSA